MTDDPLDSSQDSLLDLPLRGASETQEDAAGHIPRGAGPASAPTPSAQRDLLGDARPIPGPRAVPDDRSEETTEPSRMKRLQASLADLAAHVVVLGLLGLGVRLFGVHIDRSVLVPLLATLVAFSFLYGVPSLMIWGRTPGMAINGLIAESAGGEPVAAGQALRRWLVGWLTWLTAGLAGLLDLTDRLSGTRTRQAEASGDAA